MENDEELQGILKLIEEFVHREDLVDFTRRLGIAVLVVIVQIVLIWLVWFLMKKLSAKIEAGAGSGIKPLTIKNYKILTSKQITDVILFSLRILKYLITILQLIVTVLIVFSLFPATEDLASVIFGYFIDPLKAILLGVIKFIPNLITIVIILVVVKYVVRALKFFAKQIANEKVKVPGFYADWAWPTFNLLRVLLYAFTVALVYPYLPGSESRIFQGVSVFMGLIVSLGSSSAIGNLVAGLVITYMRPFKIGDRIKIKDITGFVVEKSTFVVRLRNIKNEFITFPNLTVLNSEVINFNTSGEQEGLILHAKITVGYDVPWRDVYKILISAATKTPHIQETPKPFVLQTSLEDFYAAYELNVYTKEIERVLLIYSLLYQNIQDEFKNAGISMFAPHYYTGSVPKPPVAGQAN
jgi:small-conductance mechanosensitive channel